MIVAAVVVTAAAVTAYVVLVKKRAQAMRRTNFSLTGPARRLALRRHLPYALMLAALPILLVGVARPQAQIKLPHIAGTVILAFDVSNSMGADDVKPSRLAAAQGAASSFVTAQPDTVDIGVVVFGQDGFATQKPTNDHSAALSAIKRMD